MRRLYGVPMAESTSGTFEQPSIDIEPGKGAADQRWCPVNSPLQLAFWVLRATPFPSLARWPGVRLDFIDLA